MLPPAQAYDTVRFIQQNVEQPISACTRLFCACVHIAYRYTYMCIVPVLSIDAPSQARTVTLCKDLQAMSAAFLTDSCANQEWTHTLVKEELAHTHVHTHAWSCDQTTQAHVVIDGMQGFVLVGYRIGGR